MRRWRTASEEETRRVGEAIAAELAPDGTLLLAGDLGSGKTVLAQGVARGLGIAPREVASPTFTLIREHAGPGGARLVHVDLYRLEPEEAAGLGLEELLAGPGVKVVEWPERLPWPVAGARRLRLARGESEGERTIEELELSSERSEGSGDGGGGRLVPRPDPSLRSG